MQSTLHLLNALIREAILTFELPGIKLSDSLDYYEERVFLRQRSEKGGYETAIFSVS